MVVNPRAQQTLKKTKQQELARVRLISKVSMSASLSTKNPTASSLLRLRFLLTKIYGMSLIQRRRVVKMRSRQKEKTRLKRSRSLEKMVRTLRHRKSKPLHPVDTTHMSRIKSITMILRLFMTRNSRWQGI